MEKKLPYIPIKQNKPTGMDYDIFREKFLNSRIGQIKKTKQNYITILVNIKIYQQNNI
jgi:hypothetical protein